MNNIAELKDGDKVTAPYLVVTVDKGVTSQSRNYLNVNLQDASGTMLGKKWDIEDGDADLFVPGQIVMISGEVNAYRGSLQMKIFSGSPVDQDNIDFTRFVPSAPVPKEELEKKLNAYVDSLTNGDVKKLTKHLIDKFHDSYVTYPAAVHNHHAFASGLLYHSLCMADHAEMVCKLYPTLNRDVLVAGALIHDLGKTIELSGPVATQFTLEGKLLGHISIMQAEVRIAAKELGMSGEIPLIMEHMVLSHHNQPDFGSPVPPETREALVLSMIDDMDAKMNILDKAYAPVKPGEWTGKIFTMDGHYFYKPLYSKDD
ncbi:MAG: HD domain-containing protein [Bacilli bacterium]|jgi:3'-5' exoribonuclease|nr:HD domain-containing protein [Bacilli bacterium]